MTTNHPADHTNPADMPLTYTGLVHLVIRCDQPGCAFQTEDYTTGHQAAEDHHKATGHNLSGEEGRALWVGTPAQEHHAQQVDRLLGLIPSQPQP